MEFTAPTNHISNDLDRAPFDSYDEPERHLQRLEHGPEGSVSDIDTDTEQDGSTADLGGLSKILLVSKKVRSRTKSKTSKIFHNSSKSRAFHEPSKAPVLAPAPSTAADDDRLFHPLPEHKGPQVKDVLRHPVDTVQSLLHGASGAKVADTMDNQVISHGADVNMVRAYDEVTAAQDEKDRTMALNDLEDLKKARQDTYVRWTMDRHVLKVRRIPPFDLPKPKKEDYTARRNSRQSGTNWAGYGEDVRFFQRSYICRNRISPSIQQ